MAVSFLFLLSLSLQGHVLHVILAAGELDSPCSAYQRL